MIFRLVIAIAISRLIGFERELKHRPAGLRTHMLVSLGVTVFTIISLSFDVEPSRTAAGIITGIGFLEAGSIIAQKWHIRRITSTVTLWIVVGMELSTGVGQHVIAVVAGLLVFAILQLGKIKKKSNLDE